MTLPRQAQLPYFGQPSPSFAFHALPPSPVPLPLSRCPDPRSPPILVLFLLSFVLKLLLAVTVTAIETKSKAHYERARKHADISSPVSPPQPRRPCLPTAHVGT